MLFGRPVLHAKHTGLGHWDVETYSTQNELSWLFLPKAVQRWSGVRTSDGKLRGWGDDCLADLNDDGADFDLIAAVIEHEL